MASNRLTRDRGPYEYLRTTNDMPAREVRAAWGTGNGQPLPMADYRRAKRSAPIYTGKQWLGGVHYLFRPVSDAMSHIMKVHDYVPVDGNWGGNRRQVRGGSTWSTHAFLVATDTFAPQNPMSSSFVSDMPPKMVEDWLSINTVDGNHRAIVWGGLWRRADAMHVNANVPPEALKRGVKCPDGAIFTVEGGTHPPEQQSKPSGVFAVGSKADQVFEIQRLLIAHDLLPAGSDDGAFGPATEKAVKAWQTKIGLEPDGVWGPGTERATRSHIDGIKTVKQPKVAPITGDPVAIVTNAYRRALGRDPAAGSLNIWADRLRSQQATPEQIYQVLARTPEGQKYEQNRLSTAASAVEAAVKASWVANTGRQPNAQQLAAGITQLMSELEGLSYR